MSATCAAAAGLGRAIEVVWEGAGVVAVEREESGITARLEATGEGGVLRAHSRRGHAGHGTLGRRGRRPVWGLCCLSLVGACMSMIRGLRGSKGTWWSMLGGRGTGGAWGSGKRGRHGYVYDLLVVFWRLSGQGQSEERLGRVREQGEEQVGLWSLFQIVCVFCLCSAHHLFDTMPA